MRLIATGGMSEVYEAEHLGLRKRVALKLLRAELAASSEARQRFLTEGTNAARIRHSNVVDVTDVGMVLDLPYLVMSLLEGEDLANFFDREAPIAVPELIDLLLPVASAVAAGHAEGVVHRDLKPDNIFLHREGSRVIPKVLDFGISRAIDAKRITLNSTVFGTPHYMSPEQARGATADARADQYALGVILYEGVTGHLPRNSSNPLELLHALASDSFRPPSEHVDLPPGLEASILRAMAHEPESRFGSMNDLALSLLSFATPAARDYWKQELRAGASEDSSARAQSVARHPSLPVCLPLATPVRREPEASAAAEAQPAAPGALAATEAAEATEAVVASALAQSPPVDSLQPGSTTIRATRRGARGWLAKAGAGVALLVALVGVWTAIVARPEPSASAKLRSPAAAQRVRVAELPGRITPITAPRVTAKPPEPVTATQREAPVTRARKPASKPASKPVSKPVSSAVASSSATRTREEPAPSVRPLEPAAPAPSVAVIDARQPRVRLIDEVEADVRVVE